MTEIFDIEPFDPLMPTKDQRFGDYELLEQIAQGGMGLVFKARQVSLNRIVALKVIRAGQLASATDVQRFRIEAEAAAHLDHPRIVPIYEIGELKSIHYFSMKLVEGGNLAQHMQRYVKDHRAAARLLAAAGRGVHYAHQRGVLHRDLKPANILVDLEGRPHVTDFGVAKRLGGACLEDHEVHQNPSISATLSGGIVGTPSYMAPEQAAGTRDGLTMAVDIYSLGAILYEMLTGRPPFKAATQLATLRQVLEEAPPRPRDLNPRVDRALEAICWRCLERQPDDRYDSAEALVHDLERWLANEPIGMQRGNAWVRTVKWVRRRPTTAALACTVLFTSALGLAMVAWQHDQAQAQEYRLRLTRLAEETERQKADDALAQLRLAQYADHLAEARQQWQASNLEAAEQALQACPSELRAWEWNLLQRLCKVGERRLKGPLANVTCLAFHADRSLVLANQDGTIAMLQGFTGEVLRQWSSEQGAVHSLAVSSNGDLLATAGADRRVAVWDARTRQRLATFTGYPEGVTAVSFGPRGQQLALAFRQVGLDGKPEAVIHVWDLARLTEPVTLPAGADVANSLVFSPAGEALAAAGEDGVIRIWSLQVREAAPRVLRGHTKAVTALAFAPDGHRLASAAGDQTVKLWSVSSAPVQEAAVSISCSAPTRRVWFTPDGTTVMAAVGRDIASWNSSTGSPWTKIERQRLEPAATTFSPQGEWVASVALSGELSLSPTVRREYTLALSGLAGPALRLALSADGRRMAVIDGQMSFAVMDTRGFQAVCQVKGHDAPVMAAVFAPDGRTVTSVDQQGTVKSWDAQTGKELSTFATGLKETTCLALAPSGQVIAISGHSGAVEVWDVASRHRVVRFDAHGTAVNRLLFSPDGQRLATASDDQTVRLWDAATGVELLALRGHTGPVLDAVFSADGKRLVSASSDQTARVWELTEGRELLLLRGHAGPVTSVAAHPDGRRLVTAGADRRLRVWNGATGTALLTLDTHECVHNLAFMHDGECLIAAAGTIRLWDAEK